MYKNAKKYLFVLLSISSVGWSADLNVRNFGAVPNDNNDDSSAIQRAINSLKKGDRLLIPSGQYLVRQSLDAENLDSVIIEGQGQAILKKSGNVEYIMRIYYSNNVTVKGISFVGNTSSEIKWGEQGLLLASSKNSSVINNTFRNFGDAAVRAHTATDDNKAINSENIRIANNSFYNVTQVTTTQAVGETHGGTKNIIIENNTFEGLRGSIKCASRKPVNLCFIRNNHIKSTLRNAVEISNFSDVTVENNIFENISNFVMNIYGNEELQRGYQWQNITIQNNIFRNARSGIRIANIIYNDGSQFDLNNIKIVNNIFDNLGAGYSLGAIGLSNNTNRRINSVNISSNFFRNIKASSYIGRSSGVALSASDNLAWPLQFTDEPYVKAGKGSFPSDVRKNQENPTDDPDSATVNLEVVLSADHYQGAPIVSVSVGGRKIMDIAVNAQRQNGDVQKNILKVPENLKDKTIVLTFNNDLYGGVGKDRNVYVHSLNMDGKTLNLSKAEWTGNNNRYEGFYDGRLPSSGSMTLENP